MFFKNNHLTTNRFVYVNQPLMCLMLLLITSELIVSHWQPLRNITKRYFHASHDMFMILITLQLLMQKQALFSVIIFSITIMISCGYIITQACKSSLLNLMLLSISLKCIPPFQFLFVILGPGFLRSTTMHEFPIYSMSIFYSWLMTLRQACVRKDIMKRQVMNVD